MSNSTLISLQQNIARYGLSILIIFGNFGNLFTVLILVQSAKRRSNSCALYLLSASICNWIVVNTALISNVVGVGHIDPQNTSNVVCKLRWSSVHTLLMLSRSLSKFLNEILTVNLYVLSDRSSCCLYRSMGTLLKQFFSQSIFSTEYCYSCHFDSTAGMDSHAHSHGSLLQQQHGSMYGNVWHLCLLLRHLFSDCHWYPSSIPDDPVQSIGLAQSTKDSISRHSIWFHDEKYHDS